MLSDVTVSDGMNGNFGPRKNERPDTSSFNPFQALSLRIRRVAAAMRLYIWILFV